VTKGEEFTFLGE